MAKSFFLRSISCPLDSASNNCGNFDWGLCGWSFCLNEEAALQSEFYTRIFADLLDLQESDVQRVFKGASWEGVSIRLFRSSPLNLPTDRSAYSHPYWPPSNDVAYTHQSTIRASPHGILDPQYLAATCPLNPPQLGNSTIHYAWPRLGDHAREALVKREAGGSTCGHCAMYW